MEVIRLFGTTRMYVRLEAGRIRVAVHASKITLCLLGFISVTIRDRHTNITANVAPVDGMRIAIRPYR